MAQNTINNAIVNEIVVTGMQKATQNIDSVKAKLSELAKAYEKLKEVSKLPSFKATHDDMAGKYAEEVANSQKNALSSLQTMKMDIGSLTGEWLKVKDAMNRAMSNKDSRARLNGTKLSLKNLTKLANEYKQVIVSANSQLHQLEGTFATMSGKISTAMGSINKLRNEFAMKSTNDGSWEIYKAQQKKAAEIQKQTEAINYKNAITAEKRLAAAKNQIRQKTLTDAKNYWENEAQIEKSIAKVKWNDQVRIAKEANERLVQDIKKRATVEQETLRKERTEEERIARQMAHDLSRTLESDIETLNRFKSRLTTNPNQHIWWNANPNNPKDKSGELSLIDIEKRKTAIRQLMALNEEQARQYMSLQERIDSANNAAMVSFERLRRLKRQNWTDIQMAGKDEENQVRRIAEEYRKQDAELKKNIRDLKIAQAEMDKFNGVAGRQVRNMNLLGNFMEKLRSHFNWIVAGAAIATTYAVPIETIDTWRELEKSMAGIKQVLNAPGQNLEHNVSLANKEMQTLIDTAKHYGESVHDIAEATRSWGRMYKDIDTVNMLVSQSAKMATADNFNLADSVKGLESAMSQFGMKSQDFNTIFINSSRILDVWTALSHKAGTTAQDLTAAVGRAGASAHQAGVSFEFFNALVAAGTRNTARTGAEIGQTLKTVFSSIHSKKAVDELKKFDIAVTETAKDGTTKFRSVQDVLLDVARTESTTTKNTEKLNLALTGGKWQVSKGSAILGDYEEIIKNWSDAVNSIGFTDEQVAVQMDTLDRRIKTLKAAFVDLTAATGRGGMGAGLNYAVDTLTNVINGFRKLGSTIITTMAAVGGIVTIWKLATGALKAYGYAQGAMIMRNAINRTALTADIATQEAAIVATKANTRATLELAAANAASETSALGMTKALVAQKAAEGAAEVAAKDLTVAQIGLNLATGNWITIGIMVIGTVLSLCDAFGKQDTTEQKLMETQQRKNDLDISNLQNAQDKKQFIDTLIHQYEELTQSIEHNTKIGKDATTASKERDMVVQALAKTLHVSSDQFLKDGKLNLTMIHQIADANIKKAKDTVLADSTELESKHQGTVKAIELVKQRIEALKKEGNAVGVLTKIYKAFYRALGAVNNWKADHFEKIAKETKYDDIRERFTKLANEARAAARQDELEGGTVGSLTEELEQLEKQEKDQATILQQQRSAYINTVTSDLNQANEHGTVDPESQPSRSGHGSNGSAKYNKQTEPLSIVSKEGDVQLNDILSQRNRLMNEYADAISRVNEKAKLYGETLDDISAKDKLLNDEEYSVKVYGKSLIDLRNQQIQNINSFASKDNIIVQSGADDEISRIKRALAYKETNGYADPYHTPSGDGLGYGKYQISYSNWDSWSREALGYVADMKSPEAQEAITSYFVNKYLKEYGGNVYKVFQAWNAGVGGAASGYGTAYASSAMAYYDNDIGNTNISISGIDKLISPAAWKALSLDGKTAFIKEHQGEITNYKAALAAINHIIKINNEIIKNNATVRKLEEQRQQAFFDGVTKLTEQVRTSAHEETIANEYAKGINVTQADKDLDLIKENTKVLEVMQKALSKFKDKTTMQYKAFLAKVQTLEMQQRRLRSVTLIQDKFNQDKSIIDYENAINEADHPTQSTAAQDSYYLGQRIKIEEELVKRLKKEVDEILHAPDGIDKALYRQTFAQYKQELKKFNDLKDAYNQGLRQASYDTMHELLLEGNKFSDIWKRLWHQLAEYALQCLFRVQKGTGGFLGRLLGIGRPSILGVASSFVFPTPSVSSFMGVPSAGQFGGITAKPLNFMAMPKGFTAIPRNTVVEPSLSPRTIQTANMVVHNPNHGKKDDEKITLMKKQNSILLQILNKPNNGNGGYGVTPVVLKQDMNTDEFSALYKKSRLLRKI